MHKSLPSFRPDIGNSINLFQHQQKTFPSGRNGSGRVDTLCQSRLRHPGGEWLRARHQDDASGHILPSYRSFAVSSRSVGLLYLTNTLALWPTVTIHRNGLIGYPLASGLQCNGWRCENLSSRSLYIKLEERRKVRRYHTTRLWGSTQLRGSKKSWTERVGPKVGKERV